jgi:hypothetical protein
MKRQGLPYDHMSDLDLEIEAERLEADLDRSSPYAHLDGRDLRVALEAIERRGIDRAVQRRKAARILEALRAVPDDELEWLWLLDKGPKSTLAGRELRRRERGE